MPQRKVINTTLGDLIIGVQDDGTQPLRPALAPRDRSLVTVSALVATGQVAQLSAHLNPDSAVENVTVKSFGVKLEGGAQSE